MIHIYDGMAVLRRRFDNDPLGRGPRSVVTEMLTLPRTDIAIWCFEGRGSLNDRRKIFPGYKDRPSTMTDGLRALVELTREALKHTRALQVAVPGREADDVIAHLCGVYGTGPGDSITVHTVDRDLKALEGGKVKVACEPLKGIEPHEVRLYKTLVGDKSDCIPGMKGFGVESFLACDRTLLARAMQVLIVGHLETACQLFQQAGVKPGMAARICTEEQIELLRKYWQVIGFLPLPDGWEQNVVAGRENAEAASAVLRQFHH